MFNTSLNVTLHENLKVTATFFTIITIVLASLTILFGLTILFRLIYCRRLQKCSSKNDSRRIGVLHSMNTYIHIIGETSIFLIMSSRTLYGDLHLHIKEESAPSWHCRLLNYLMSMFAAGIYGSCFVHAVFRYWRIMKPHRRLYRTFSFHLQLIFLHIIYIIVISIPVWFRAIYLSSENYCLNHFNDTWISIYISITATVLPIFGIVIVHFKIVMYMKQNWQSRKRWKRMERDLLMIKRLLLVVVVLSNTSGAAILLWLLMYIQKFLHPLSYRLLCFIIEIGMLICSITLLIVSPQLRRALGSTALYKQHSDSNNTINNNKIGKLENESWKSNQV
ncbi:unnamed protein product [Adineta steineri]|uniref:G-protein coupled receptors family 1 profile domain-containing protein n=1 Tax=Adineta steineri TaxID=433720 RepID=A0A818TTI0_9BILA|nr:unnamed protein product [Adineta steineri]